MTDSKTNGMNGIASAAAQVAQTWSCRPSDLVQATGTTALQLDIAAAVALWRWQSRIQDLGFRI